MIRSIVAIDVKNGIAKNGTQPWSIPDDEHYFTTSTKSHGATVLMGRKTFEVIGRPLLDRHNIVVSRDRMSIEGVEVISDVITFLGNYKTDQDIWVIGGASIYELILQLTDELYITKIDSNFKCDQFFPSYESQFNLIEQSGLKSQNGLNYRFCRYAKKH
jgi:dihydrofolate reductase